MSYHIALHMQLAVYLWAVIQGLPFNSPHSILLGTFKGVRDSLGLLTVESLIVIIQKLTHELYTKLDQL